MGAETLSAADGFVIAMLVMMAASLGVLVGLALCMRRNVARRDRQVDELLDELDEDEKREAHAGAEDTPPAQPWEKDADWWKG